MRLFTLALLLSLTDVSQASYQFQAKIYDLKKGSIFQQDTWEYRETRFYPRIGCFLLSGDDCAYHLSRQKDKLSTLEGCNEERDYYIKDSSDYVYTKWEISECREIKDE